MAQPSWTQKQKTYI